MLETALSCMFLIMRDTLVVTGYAARFDKITYFTRVYLWTALK